MRGALACVALCAVAACAGGNGSPAEKKSQMLRNMIDRHFELFSRGDAEALLKQFDKNATVLFPPLPDSATPVAAPKHGEPQNLTTYYAALTGSLTTRRARATNIVVDGMSAMSAWRCDGGIGKSGRGRRMTDYGFSGVFLWVFIEDDEGRALIHSMRSVEHGEKPQRLTLSLEDKGEVVNATICLPPRGGSRADAKTTPVPLLVFGHGLHAGMSADDYDYVCDVLSVYDGRRWVVALVRSAPEDPDRKLQPLEPLARAARVLSRALAGRDELRGRLSAEVFLGGHSTGAGAAVLAAQNSGGIPGARTSVDALVLWAPGLYGEKNADAEQVTVPTLIVAGADDCVNVPSDPLRSIDTYQKLASKQKALVIIKGANHCFFTTPVKGTCGYDTCTNAPRLSVQAAGIRMLQEFASAVLDAGTAADSWARFEDFVRKGSHPLLPGIEWKAAVTSDGSSDIEGLAPVIDELCPEECKNPQTEDINKAAGNAPPPPENSSTESEPAKRVRAYYDNREHFREHVNSDKLEKVPELLKQFKGREWDLLLKLRAKFGPLPGEETEDEL